jgi:flagellar assembly factor FliW
MNTLELMELDRATTPSDDVVLLPYGLIGFERVKNYSLLTNPDEDPFLWFKMLDDARHAFLVLSAGAFVPDYSPDFEDQDIDFLELDGPSDALILNTVTQRDAGTATVNLKGPIVINRRTWIGKQVVPKYAGLYPVRHPLPIT